MNAKVRKVIVVLGLSLLCGLFIAQTTLLAGNRSTIEKVDEALQEGRINLKTAVLQKAEILFGNKISLQPKTDVEALEEEANRLELFEDVRRVFDQLSRPQRRYLSSLSPVLKQVINEETKGTRTLEAATPQRLPTAYDRVSKAADMGEITLKEAVLAKAQLLFAPRTMTAGHPFRAQAGEIAVAEEGQTGFYKDIHRVFAELTEDEKAFLGSLSPDLDVIISTRDREQTGAVGAPPLGALPSYPDLTETEEGKNCTVHYTLTGANAVPNKTYAELVRLYMDMAIGSKMVTHFKKAFAEGYADFAGKLHVYVSDISGNGEWVDVSTVSGPQRAGYIKISSKIQANYGTTWQLKLKGVCFHEYFHGIQSAYNWASALWFMEATTVWASCYYGGDWAHVGSYYAAGDSVYNTPNDVIWLTSYRKYSTSALAFFLSEKFGGYKFIKSYFENSAAKDDGIQILNDTLAASTTTFGEQYPYYLASMYSKKIKSIAKYAPALSIKTTHNTYGAKVTTDQVHLTGANFYLLDPEVGTKPSTLISTFTAGATGSPAGVLVRQKSNVPIPFTSGRAHMPAFGGSAKQVALIVTDTNYTSKDTALRGYEYTVITPSITITDVTALSPIYSGDYSPIDIYYDLTGTIPGEDFPVELKVTEKGPDVSDQVSGEWILPTGLGQILNLYFNTAYDTVGTYKFTFELSVPPNSWLPIPQVKSKGSCSVKVEAPPEPEGVTPARLSATTGKQPNLSPRK
jgi:hypothetical protein